MHTINSNPQTLKPVTHAYDLRQHLPPALAPLRDQRRFVVWKWELDKNGEWTKPPYRAHSPKYKASTTNPKTWGTFEQACRAVEAGEADGVGFCLLGTDVSAFDIDDCRDSVTGAIHPVAKALVDRAGSYSEVTVSGTGLRIIGTGSDRHMHTKKTKVNGSAVSIEAYRNCERYITLSGLQLDDTPQRMNDIDALIDDVVAELGGVPSHDNIMTNDVAAANDNFEGLYYIEARFPDELIDLIRDGAPVGERSDQFFHAVKEMKDLKVRLPIISKILRKYPNGIAAKYVGRIEKEVARCYGKPDTPKPDKAEDIGTVEAKTKLKLIESSEEFTRGFVPPDYLLDGVCLKGFMYSMTAPTGHGKTAVMLLFAAAVAQGKDFAGLEVAQGRVLYFAGENPEDVRMRWIAMAEHQNFDSDLIDVHFISGTFSIAKMEKKITQEVAALGGVALVIIDTGPAFFQGESENDNVDMLAHAKLMRRLVNLPGKPTVIAAMHPTKSAGRDNLLPRGGGAFLNEIDGNMTCWRDDTLVTLHWQGKHRGANFEPLMFELQGVTARKLVNSKGGLMPTVIVTDLSKEDQQARTSNVRAEQDEILVLLKGRKHPTSLAQIADELVWRTKDHKPNKSKVQRLMDGLKDSKYVESDRDGAVLTKKGQAAAERATERNPHLQPKD